MHIMELHWNLSDPLLCVELCRSVTALQLHAGDTWFVFFKMENPILLDNWPRAKRCGDKFGVIRGLIPYRLSGAIDTSYMDTNQ